MSLQKKWIFQYLAVLLNPVSVQCHCSIYVFAAMQLIDSQRVPAPTVSFESFDNKAICACNPCFGS